ADRLPDAAEAHHQNAEQAPWRAPAHGHLPSAGTGATGAGPRPGRGAPGRVAELGVLAAVLSAGDALSLQRAQPAGLWSRWRRLPAQRPGFRGTGALRQR